MAKNPYHSDTPEWQLYENMVSNERLVVSYTADIERAEVSRAVARIKAERYAEALKRIDAAKASETQS